MKVEDASSTRPRRFPDEQTVSVYWELTENEWQTFERMVCSRERLQDVTMGKSPALDRKLHQWIDYKRRDLHLFENETATFIVSTASMTKFFGTHPEQRTTAERRF